ncbi:ATP-dependent DNA ligase [soil metagenome]
MLLWSEVAARVSSTTRTSAKVATLAEYLRGLQSDELPLAVSFFTGRPFAERDPRSVGIGWAAVASVAEGLVDAPAGALSVAYNASSDLGQAVGDLLAEHGHVSRAESPSLPEVADAFGRLAAARGPAAKRAILAELFARCDPAGARWVTKILTGELRIGLREGHLENAIATAFGRPLADVQWAGMLSGDLGQTAELARDGRLDEAALALFRPLKLMLASPVADEAEVLKRLGAPVWVEDKYDGIRAQLHRRGSEVRLFSRDLNDVTSGYPEVVRAASALAWDGVLDGELLAFRDGMALPFLQLQGRLGRKNPSADLQLAVPVIFVAFDVLALGGGGQRVEPLLRLPLSERRQRLDELGLPDVAGFATAKLINASTVADLAAVFDAAQQRGNEGLMVKDPDSLYTPGRRGYGWLKLKRPLATLDCVVVGVEVGHGKRHGVLSDYTFAVRDERPGADGRLTVIGKAYSGLTDAELAEMTSWFEAHTLRRMGRFYAVDPSVVVEVAFDVIHRSNRHDSGYALRFPRIHRLRRDKDSREIDTLSTVEMLHQRLQQGGRYRVLTSTGPAPAVAEPEEAEPSARAQESTG